MEYSKIWPRTSSALSHCAGIAFLGNSVLYPYSIILIRWPDSDGKDHETMFYPNYRLVRFPKKYIVRLVIVTFNKTHDCQT